MTQQTVRAMVVTPEGDDGRLDWRAVPAPVPRSGEVVVAVHASGVNRADLLQRRGKYVQEALRRPGPVVAGMEVAGEVLAIGDEVTGVEVGDRVMAMCEGSYAEQAVVHHRLLLPVPAGLSWEEAAALPLGLMTAYDALFGAGEFAPGEAVLVSSATSIVGRIAVQLARAGGASVVVGTSRSAEGRERILALGANHAVDGAAEDVAERIEEATGGRKIDVVVDQVGASLFAAHLRVLAVGGRLISVGRLGGAAVSADLNQLALNRITVRGVTFRTRTLDEYAAIAEGVRKNVLDKVAANLVRPAVDHVLPIESAAEAQDLVATGVHQGKIVLTV
ncbi:hypothetical protein SGFS_097970 [Streptomyces graminofaciens]|uniref:Enoyl reductase (ER) domain-containing protein n=1 Tax=Streptomyces graminofaciens TaxID=68212 RepID=A0ABM7FQI7_9ACTN|nr:hypothetical protein SGFS_097970 [Streptomyces graminofaciens]